MSWFSENKDLLTVSVAFVGIALALYTALTNRNQRRRDALYRIHDLLTSSDQQHGRRLLYESARTGTFPDVDTEAFATMNRAIATLNAVGLYVRRGIVPGRWVLETWHHPLTDIKPAADAFLAYRRSRQNNTGWRVAIDLEDLLQRAARYRSRMACCVGAPQEVPSATAEPDPTVTAAAI